MARNFFLRKSALSSISASLISGLSEVSVKIVMFSEVLKKATTLDDDDTRGSGRSTFAF
ncbi:hypothetical protein [Lyngbya aestuarii]|uniref:hypothetical protein n=1 Tax=Lyngbya aestuarii TaxID=118322 RepID=UPI00403D79B9